MPIELPSSNGIPFEVFADYASDLIAILDAAGKIRYLSASSKPMLGYEPASLVGRNVLEFIHPDDAAGVISSLELLIHGPEAVHRTEFRFPHHAGGWRVLEARGSNRLEDPAVQGLIVVTRDVTEQRAAEQALRESEERFRELAENIDRVFWMRDVGRQVLLYVSPAYEQIWGRRVADLLEDPGQWVDAILAEDRERMAAAAESSLKEGRDDVYRILRPDGEIRWIHDRAFPIRSASGEIYRIAGLAEDVTERKQVEEELRAARAGAERANQAKSDFLSRMSHELRTPLNAILGFAQLLEMDAVREEDVDSIHQILRAGRHLLGVVDEVLDIAAIEAGRMHMAVEPVHAAEVIRDSWDLVRNLALQREIGVHLELGDESGALVWADEQRLKQVLLNLFSNAIKFNRRGGAIEVVARPLENGHLRIEVTDSGSGVAPDQLPRLFSPFDRLGADRRGVEGTGLGLALSRGLVEAMGGSMGVRSIEGEGSTFWVDLLCPEPSAIAPPPEADDARPTKTHTVLLVEDNLANARLIGHLFQRRPHVRLLTAVQGRMALELAQEHRPDLVLLDLHLPDLSGDQVLQDLQRNPELRDIPVVLMSGGAHPSQVEELLAAGARAFLTKPFELQELLRVVEENLT